MIYFYHLERTGGTSITKAILQAVIGDYKKAYKEMTSNDKGTYKYKDKLFIGWTRHLLEGNNYYYGFSHIPMFRYKPPKKAFTFTIIRNPIDRLVSYYKILMDIEKSGKHNWFERKERDYVGDFAHFLEKVSRKKRLKQLYTFSHGFNVDEAEKNIKSLSYYFKFEDFDEGVKTLGKKIGLNLKPLKTNVGKTKVDISGWENTLKETMEEELELYNRL